MPDGNWSIYMRLGVVAILQNRVGMLDQNFSHVYLLLNDLSVLRLQVFLNEMAVYHLLDCLGTSF